MSLHALLRDELSSLAKSTSTSRSAALKKHAGAGSLPPLDGTKLRESVKNAWDTATAAASSSSKSRDVLRSTLDLVGRDVAVRPVMDGSLPEPLEDAGDKDKARFQTDLQDRLDTVLTLFEIVGEEYSGKSAEGMELMVDLPALEPGAVFIPFMEEFVELLSIPTWHTLFAYMETRAPRFCKDMPASRGKALPLLRIINSFLRFLSHTPQDLKLRGRVQLFASSAISVSDKSAINVRGEYAAITTTVEEDVEADGDVTMEEEGKGKSGCATS